MSELSLKEAARLARSRFKKGFWLNYNQSKEDAILNAAKSGEDESLAIKKLLYGANEQIKFTDNINEDFLAKVEEILSSGEFVLNPLSKLIDSKYYESLTENEKQKYILTLSDKFNAAKEKLAKAGS